MGDIAFNTVTKHILLGIRYTSKLSFGPQLEYLRTQVKSQTADLVAAGVHPGGLDMHTSISMWRFIYTPKLSSSIHIWIETHMHTELTSIILAPLRAILNAHPGIGTTVMDDLTLCVELRVSGLQSLLLHADIGHSIRLRTKTDTNAAALYYRHRHAARPRPQDIQSTIDSMNRIGLSDPVTQKGACDPNWREHLSSAITVYERSEHIRTARRSHNAMAHARLIMFEPYGQTSFIDRFPGARNVLLVRLQAAPLATHRANSTTAACRRCDLVVPDSLEHFLFECPALSVAHLTRDLRLHHWSAEIDRMYDNKFLGNWAATSLRDKLLACQGIVPPCLNALNNYMPHTAIKEASYLMTKFISIMDKFYEKAFPSAEHALKTGIPQ